MNPSSYLLRYPTLLIPVTEHVEYPDVVEVTMPIEVPAEADVGETSATKPVYLPALKIQIQLVENVTEDELFLLVNRGSLFSQSGGISAKKARQLKAMLPISQQRRFLVHQT